MGDWLDAQEVSQGSQSYASLTIGLGSNTLDVTALVKRWSENQLNRGFYLRSQQAWPFRFAGRNHATPSFRPLLEIVTGSGSIQVPCICNATWAPSSAYGKDSRDVFDVAGTSTFAAVQFDLSQFKGQVIKASLTLNCLELKYAGLLEVFELNPPSFRLGAGNSAPLPGMAMRFPGDKNIGSQTSVLFASDFSELTQNRWAGTGAPGSTQVADPGSGSTYLRGVIAKGQLLGADLEHNVVAGRADGVAGTVETSLFARYMVYLEKDWGSGVDANKMPGWDGRLGWWNEVGYWQSTTGNGGSRGSGKKVLNPPTGRVTYEGSSMRGLGGTATNDGNPYDELFYLANYMYHLDQPTNFGEDMYWPGVVLSKERWFSIEQQIVMNSISGPYDEFGNGVANRDGQYRVWVDGVLAWERTDLRWRRHPDMGIQGFWLNWYHGGVQPAPADMHFRMDSVVIAREYIGPRAPTI